MIVSQKIIVHLRMVLNLTKAIIFKVWQPSSRRASAVALAAAARRYPKH
jgi:hypothetical protein